MKQLLNLLPKKEKKKIITPFLLMVVAIVILSGSLLSFVSHLYKKELIASEEVLQHYEEEEEKEKIEMSKTEKELLGERREVIEKLKKERFDITPLMEFISNRKSVDYARITNLSYTRGSITFDLQVPQMVDVSRTLIGYEQLPWVKKVEMSGVSRIQGGKESNANGGYSTSITLEIAVEHWKGEEEDE